MATATARRAAPRARPRSAGREQAELDIAARRLLNRRACVGLALGVVRNGELSSFHGHGLADVASGRPVTEETVFRIGSITKTITAIAVMQLRERGLIDLDAPANDYLRGFQLIPHHPANRPATIRHLMTHTAGVPEVLRPLDVLKPLFGEIVPKGRRVPTSAELYRGGLRLGAEPGSRFIYTDHGFAALAQVVEDVSGEPFDAYLRAHVFEPLGMRHTDLVRSERVRAELATGYELRGGEPQPVDDYELVTAGGGGVYSTTRDMARYVAALMGGGTNESGSVLEPASMALMFEPHYRGDPRVPGIGLAFDRHAAGGHRLIGHGGIMIGFNSQMFVAPDDGLGIIGLTNGASQAMLWLPTELGRVLNALLGLPEEAIRTDVPHRPEVWGRIRGRYAISAGLTDVRARLVLGGGVEVFVRGGRPMLRVLHVVPALLRGLPLQPDDEADPYAFRVDLSALGVPPTRVVFGPTWLATDLFPFAMHRRPSGARRRALGMGMLGAGLALGVASAARRLRAARRPRAARRR